ncbi:MAG TPA: CAP domain-containing protein [Ktedonobacteraceae bacterium]
MRKHAQPGLSAVILALLVMLLAACAGTGSAGNQGQAQTTPTANTTSAANVTATAAITTPTPSPTPKPKKTATPKPTPTTATNYLTSTSAAQAVFQLVNQERASKGLPAFKWSSGLVRSAHLHNLWMLRDNKLSHQLPGEAGLFPRINAQGVYGSMVAENIGYGWGNAVKAALGLNTSMFNETPPDDGHRLNILSKATIIGIDVIVNPKNNQVWLTEDFAQTA